jgi:pyrroline-5-carboxylate reductase
MNITIIGAGSIGGALARGWSKKEADLKLTVSGVHWEKLNKIKEDCPAVEVMVDDTLAIKDADVIVIAVKPWQVETVINDIKPNLTSSQLLVSLAAGVTLEDIKAILYKHQCQIPSLFYVIPNIAAEFCESMTFICSADEESKKHEETIDNLFKLVGDTFCCAEKMVAPGMLMASCGIAYVMRFLRVQTEAGVEMGFYPKDALKIAIQTMKGASELLHKTGEHPEQAIDRVTTPGGYTIKGLNEMDHAGFNSAVIRVFKTGYEK